MAPVDDQRPVIELDASRAGPRAVAYHLLGSIAEADALEAPTVEAAARLALARLGARADRRWEPHVPDPVLAGASDDPHAPPLLIDGVTGLGVVAALDVLTAAERVAFVLHDLCRLRFLDVA